jgi:hypothetical protein
MGTGDGVRSRQTGKAIAVATTTPSADGKTITVVAENKLKGNSMTFKANKQ